MPHHCWVLGSFEQVQKVCMYWLYRELTASVVWVPLSMSFLVSLLSVRSNVVVTCNQYNSGLSTIKLTYKKLFSDKFRPKSVTCSCDRWHLFLDPGLVTSPPDRSHLFPHLGKLVTSPLNWCGYPQSIPNPVYLSTAHLIRRKYCVRITPNSCYYYYRYWNARHRHCCVERRLAHLSPWGTTSADNDT